MRQLSIVINTHQTKKHLLFKCSFRKNNTNILMTYKLLSKFLEILCYIPHCYLRFQKTFL